MTKISLVKCGDYNKAGNAIRKAVTLFGGINVWEVTGMGKIYKEESVELINFEVVGFKEFDIGDKNIKKVNFSNAVLDCDGIINLPKLKTHMLMGFSTGIKNFY
jgi:uncharacterized protein (DUF362 family)